MKNIIRLVFCALFMFVSASIYCRAADTVKVGVTLSMTSENGEWGRRSLAGIKMRVNEWNKAGKIPAVELVVRDDKGLEAQSRANVRELVEKEKVVALLGPCRSQYFQIERDYLKEHKVVAISPSATNPEIGRKDDWNFRLMFSDSFQTAALAHYAYDILNLHRVSALINTAYPYPENVFNSFAQCFTNLGGEVARVERYNWEYDPDNVFDFQSAIQRIAQDKPDAVFVPLYFAEVIEVLNESLNTDFKAVFLGTDTWDSGDLLESGGNRLRDSYFISGNNPELRTPEMQHFLSLYEESEEPYIALGSVFGYDAASVLLHALEGSDSPDAIREKVLNLKDLHLATGPIFMDPTFGTLRPAYVHHIIKDGDFFRSDMVDSVWPTEVQGCLGY